MGKAEKRPEKKVKVEEEEEEEVEEEETKSFEELGLDPRLIHALNKKNLHKPTPIQQSAIPYILEGKDVVAQAKTGSGKTYAYLLPLLQKLFSNPGSKKKPAPSAFILVPTKDLCAQVHKWTSELIELCRVELKAVRMISNMPDSEKRAVLAGPPDILVCTPACIPKCLSAGVLEKEAIKGSLEILVLDEADYLLADEVAGYLDDIRTLTSLIPRSCQCLLMSATTSKKVDELKKLILHNPVNLTLQESGNKKEEAVPKNIQQYWISCSARDKLLYTYALLEPGLVHKKVLIFTNTVEAGYKLKIFLEKLRIKSAILNAKLPLNSRHHILERFNAGLFDYLIATDDSQTKKKEEASGKSNKDKKKSRKHTELTVDSEFGLARGIDFKNVFTVINFDMPQSITGYIHRIGRTGRAYSTGVSISLVSPDEMEVFEEIQSFLQDNSNSISPFDLLTKNQVEFVRYRAEDLDRRVTRVLVREREAEDVRNEILNSEKLKAHFAANPRDLELLKQDKVLSENAPAAHLRNLPDYLIDPKTKEASKMVKLDRAAMGNNRSGHGRVNKRRTRKRGDPLKTFSADGPKRRRKDGANGDEGSTDFSKHKKQTSF